MKEITNLESFDKSGMVDIILNLPQSIRETKKITEKIEIKTNFEVDNIVITGMGGSAIGGDILRATLSKVPIFVNRYYSLPEFVDSKTLLFVISYSGNTEETLASYEDGKKRNANIFCISSGGKLSEFAQKDRLPLVKIPGGMQPRCAIGYLSTPLFIILKKLGIVDLDRDLEDTVNLLKEMRKELSPNREIEKNEAKKIASKLFGKFPLIYTSYPLDFVANRWRTQLNENSEVLAHINILPELDHNEIVGIGTPVEVSKLCEVILLRDRYDLDRIQKRYEITKEIILPFVSGITEVWSKGRTVFSKLFSLIYLGDWVSFYLAILNKKDPTEIKRINYLKERLK